jgi:hypothetical protein
MSIAIIVMRRSLRNAVVASARTPRESADCFDHRTTTALASGRAFSVI